MGHGNVEKNMLKPRDDPLVDSDDERPESFDDDFRRKEMRRGIDLATTLERIEKNFVITDPRLPDNPIVRQQLGSLLLLTPFFFLLTYISTSHQTISIVWSMLQIFASDSFLQLTEYSREEILGRNCR